jgi:hypothetical protein
VFTDGDATGPPSRIRAAPKSPDRPLIRADAPRTSCGKESTWPCCAADRTARSLPGRRTGADPAGRDPQVRLRGLTRATADHARRSDRAFPASTRRVSRTRRFFSPEIHTNYIKGAVGAAGQDGSNDRATPDARCERVAAIPATAFRATPGRGGSGAREKGHRILDERQRPRQGWTRWCAPLDAEGGRCTLRAVRKEQSAHQRRHIRFCPAPAARRQRTGKRTKPSSARPSDGNAKPV